MIALKHHHHDMIVAATTDGEDVHKLLFLEGFSCFRVTSFQLESESFSGAACRFEMWFDGEGGERAHRQSHVPSSA